MTGMVEVRAKLGGYWLQDGYKLEEVVGRLTYPTSMEMTPDGDVYIVESGFAWEWNFSTPRISRLNRDGTREKIIEGNLNRPVIGIKWHEGAFLVTHRGCLSRITLDGKREDLVTGIPAVGDHHTNHIVVKDGKVYFGQGSATNTGVVGPDNIVPFGWVKDTPNGHDTPPFDIKLTGQNFSYDDPLHPGKTVETGAFMPFGKKCEPGQIVKGQLKSNSVVYRCNFDGSGLEVYAWGFRNPYGLVEAPDGRLLALDQGSDPRGCRPLPCPDNLYEVKQGAWYGWPDFLSGYPATEIEKERKIKDRHGFVMAEHPELSKPILRLPTHSAATCMAFSKSDKFGYKGEGFISEFGAAPGAALGEDMFAGHKIWRLDMKTMTGSDFYRVKVPGAFGVGPERPVFVKFSNDGNALYIVDFGVYHDPHTGGLWKITKQ